MIVNDDKGGVGKNFHFRDRMQGVDNDLRLRFRADQEIKSRQDSVENRVGCRIDN